MNLPVASGLYARTVALLNGRPRNLTLTQIASDTELSVRWLSAFGAGTIANPGVISVEKLHDYLTVKANV